MSRSGNHAIINWVIRQLNGRYCFLNCAEPKCNPFVTSRPFTEEGTVYSTNIPAFDLRREQQGEFSPKDYLLYSYEDCFLGSLDHSDFRKNREKWIGESGERKTVLILRDPFNLFASRIKSGLLLGHHTHWAKPISPQTLKRIYKQHAREYLGEKNNLKNKQPVSFNRWTTDREYRKSIARRLNIRFTDQGVDEVSRVAGGSSFDGLKFSKNARSMQLQNRWKAYASEEAYWELFDDELAELTREIFGEIQPLSHYSSLSATISA